MGLSRINRNAVFLGSILVIVFFFLPFSNSSAIEGQSTLEFRQYATVQLTVNRKPQTIHWWFDSDDSDCSTSLFLFSEENYNYFLAVVNGSIHSSLYQYLLYNSLGTSASGDVTFEESGVYFFIFMHTDPASGSILLSYRVTYNSGEDTELDNSSKIVLIIVSALVAFLIGLFIFSKSSKKKLVSHETIGELELSRKLQEEHSFNCPECGEILEIGLERCPICSKAICCTICKLQIEYNESLLKCPFCGCISHSEHFLEWLSIKNSCPKCMRSLSYNELIHVS